MLPSTNGGRLPGGGTLYPALRLALAATAPAACCKGESTPDAILSLDQWPPFLLTSHQEGAAAQLGLNQDVKESLGHGRPMWQLDKPWSPHLCFPRRKPMQLWQLSGAKFPRTRSHEEPNELCIGPFSKLHPAQVLRYLCQGYVSTLCCNAFYLTQ